MKPARVALLMGGLLRGVGLLWDIGPLLGRVWLRAVGTVPTPSQQDRQAQRQHQGQAQAHEHFNQSNTSQFITKATFIVKAEEPMEGEAGDEVVTDSVNSVVFAYRCGVFYKGKPPTSR